MWSGGNQYIYGYLNIATDIDRQQRNCTRLEKVNSVLIYIELILFIAAAVILTFTFF